MSSQLWRGTRATRLRIVSGLVLFLYTLTHFLIIALGVFSPDLMDQAQSMRMLLTRSYLGSLLIYGALFVHAGLAFADLTKRRTFRMPFVEALQILIGIAIPALLVAHVVHTRIAHEVYELNDRIGYIMILLHGHVAGIKQSALLLIVWLHGCIGLHMWLRSTTWWRRWTPALMGAAVLVPSFALVSFLVEGRRLSALFAQEQHRLAMYELYNFPDQDMFKWLISLTEWLLIGFAGLLCSIAVIYLIRQGLRKRGSVRIRYVRGPQIDATKGQTLLEMSRAHSVPHTALCGGRGRCTTCRVVIEEGLEHLDPPSPAEAKSLTAVGASANMRLACLITPQKPLTVFRVFEQDGARQRAHASQGEEKVLALLFLDMRGFTARTTGQLPYDVVFLLNRFFDAIVPAITDAGGAIDKYLGDGFLAVFELPTAAQSAQAALSAVQDLGKRLQRFNAILQSEGQAEVNIGIGLHLGDVVLGEIGAIGQAPRTLIGDTVNTASRLEGRTKELQVQALISAPVLDAAGYKIASNSLMPLTLRGVTNTLNALQVPEISVLKTQLEHLTNSQ